MPRPDCKLFGEKCCDDSTDPPIVPPCDEDPECIFGGCCDYSDLDSTDPPLASPCVDDSDCGIFGDCCEEETIVYNDLHWLFTNKTGGEDKRNITDTFYKKINATDKGTKPTLASKLSDTHLQGPSIILSRWRQYQIELTASYPELEFSGKRVADKGEKTLQLDINTFKWDCQDKKGTRITQTQFCDNVKHCPNGRDEDEDICQVSQLPKKMSYLFYVYMLAIILGYFTLLMDAWPESENQNIKMIAKQSFEKCLYQRDESEFKALYVEIHQFDPSQVPRLP